MFNINFVIGKLHYFATERKGRAFDQTTKSTGCSQFNIRPFCHVYSLRLLLLIGPIHILQPGCSWIACTYVTRFGLIHASNFPTLTRHNLAYSWAIASNFCGINFRIDNTVIKYELNCFTIHWVTLFQSCKMRFLTLKLYV